MSLRQKRFRSTCKNSKAQTPTESKRELVQLPSDVLLRVFLFLPQTKLGVMAQVCKEWRTLALNPSLWLHIDESILDLWYGLKRHRTFTDYVAFLSQPRFRCLSELKFPPDMSLAGCHNIGITSDGKTVNPLSEKLLYITTSEYQTFVDDKHIKKLSKSCPDIRTLSIPFKYKCTAEDLSGFAGLPNITSVHASELIQGLPELCERLGARLTELQIMFYDRGSGQLAYIIEHVARHCPCLRALNIRAITPSYWRTTSQSKKYSHDTPVDLALVQLVDACLNLERLTVTSLCGPGGSSGLVYKHIKRRKDKGDLVCLRWLGVGLAEINSMDDIVVQGLHDHSLLHSMT